jgi:hypothetical protein
MEWALTQEISIAGGSAVGFAIAMFLIFKR